MKKGGMVTWLPASRPVSKVRQRSRSKKKPATVGKVAAEESIQFLVLN